MERETGLEPATSSLGIQTYVGSKSLARFCCEFLNLQHLAESAFSKSVDLNEAEMRQVVLALVGTHLGHVSNVPRIRSRDISQTTSKNGRHKRTQGRSEERRVGKE